MTARLPDVAAKKKQEPTAEEQAATELVRQARERGLSLTDQAQSIVATPACLSDSSCSLSASAGVFQPRVSRGRLFSVRATASISSAFHRDRSVPFEKYCRSSPLDAPMFVKILPLLGLAELLPGSAGRDVGRGRV
jgi:hypothetical protein